MSPKSTTISAPGKVLAAGGYLILDPSYSGVVISTSSRFYTVLEDSAAAGGSDQIRVRSPQFLCATWKYSVGYTGGVAVKDAIANKNKFVHLALLNTLLLAVEVRGVESVRNTLSTGLDVTIVGDNDFYSQRAKLASLNLPRTSASLKQITPFTPQEVHLADVHKTGLGSSAALITSLVSALLLHFEVIPEASFENVQSEGRKLAHNLAQYVHCLAQGKVGSGFDVSAAVFGSHLYTRFNPAVLNGLMNDEQVRNQALYPILSSSNTDWDYKVQPFKLPPLTRLMLADVDAGSDTPSLVGKVLKWRKDKIDESHTLWTALDQLNSGLARTLLKLSDLHSQDKATYVSAVRYISSLQPIQWTADPNVPKEQAAIAAVFYEAHTTAQAVRQKMREMGTLSGVPIEPKEQTDLLDACVSKAGIIGGGVPGAGGYDAIWLLVCDPDLSSTPEIKSPFGCIEHVWSEYTSLDVSPLSATESAVKGARIEDIDAIAGLREAIQ